MKADFPAELSTATLRRGATVGVGDMVTLVEGRLKDQVGTVKHVMKAALFLHSKCAFAHFTDPEPKP